MCTEFLGLLEIKPTASYQAEHIHVYVWPTLFGRTIINLWNYNLKHNEVRLLKKILQLLNGVKAARPHRLVPPPFFTSIKSSRLKEVQVFMLPPFLAGIEPSICILGDEFQKVNQVWHAAQNFWQQTSNLVSLLVRSPLSQPCIHRKHPDLGNLYHLLWSLRKLWWFY